MIRRLKASQFAKQVSTLATGSLLAQLITLMTSPITTRLYSPESYAVLALFTAIVQTLAPAASGRYEIAVVVAKEPADSKGLLVLSSWVAGGVSALMLVVLAVAHGYVTTLLNAGGLGFWLMLTPLALFLTAQASALRYYANSHKNYLLISRVAVAQALLGSSLSIGLGWGGFETTGLLFATLSGLVFGSGYLIYSNRQSLKALNWRFDRSSWRLASRYKQFPLYSAIPSFLDALTLALPVFFLTKYFPEAIVGYYALLTRVATAPLGFISNAVSQVHLKKVADLVHQQQRATKYLAQITLALSGIVAAPTIILMLYAPNLFAWIFGPQWREAGELLVILMPALAVRFVVGTLSGAVLSTGNSHLGAFWQVTAFLAVFGMFTAFAEKLSATDLFFAMMITDVLLYLLYYGLIWLAVSKPRALG